MHRFRKQQTFSLKQSNDFPFFLKSLEMRWIKVLELDMPATGIIYYMVFNWMTVRLLVHVTNSESRCLQNPRQARSLTNREITGMK